jgi:hypothetical protein
LTTPVRTPGKLGARPAVFPAGLRDLTHYVAGDLPKAPASVPVPSVAEWGMDGNDSYGDCGVAGCNHLLMAAAADTRETESFPTADQVVSYYLTYTGGQDSGVVLSDFLAYVRKTGFYGHTVSAYAPVQVHDVPTLTTALWLYDAVYTGITVTQGMMDAFQAGQPWDLTAAQGEAIGGHCVPGVGYSDEGLTVITWGEPQLITWPAWHAVSTEAWAVIPGELASGDGRGVSLADLTADLDKLDVPSPAPAPQFGPPGLLAEVAALAREVAASADRDIAEVVAFLHAHGL